MQAETPQISYYQQRCDAIGLTPEKNKLVTKEHKALKNSPVIEYPLLCEEEKTGNVIIPVYDLSGHQAQYYLDNSGKLQSGKQKPYEITRFAPGNEPLDKNGNPRKYNTPIGTKTLPWISPNIIASYNSKTKINTLIITEGYIKAISGYLNGLYIFGLSGIQNGKNKDSGMLHDAILEVINNCEVENIILLYDGDCNHISLKALGEGKDLYKRPHGFLTSAKNLNELLKDARKVRHFDVYFASINTNELEKQPKGLDDLFQDFSTDAKGIYSELTSFSKQKPYYFTRINITAGLHKVLHHLRLDGVNEFYLAHGTIIGDKPFIYNGSTFQYSAESKECKIIVPGESKFYFRVNDDYYKIIHVPNEYGNLELKNIKVSKTTITDDHGKNILKFIKKYHDFCIVPEHLDYQEVINNCKNIYYKLEHEPSENSECETTLSFIKHIFGDHYELGLDYIQLLYQKPKEKLPILSLVSKENKTGKSTFAEFLKEIFKSNMTTIGNDQLENNFNAGWATKLIICCEESFIDKKKTVEKIKSLSTGKKIEMEKKGIDTTEMAFFGKFILNSNNETNFTIVNEQDTRYWVIKVPVIENEIPDLIVKLESEIPNFLCYLNLRHLHVPTKESRMWFNPSRLKTTALQKLIEGNISGPQKEITSILKNLFTDTGFWQIQLTLKYICETLLRNRYERNYITTILQDRMNLKCGLTSKRFSFPTIKTVAIQNDFNDQIVIEKTLGKPYTFSANEFLNATEIDAFELSYEAVAFGQLEFVPEAIRLKSNAGVITFPADVTELTEDNLPF